MFFKYRHLMVMLPRQEGKTELGIRLMRSLIENDHETRQALFLAKSGPSLKKMSSEKFKRLFGENDKFVVNQETVFNKNNPKSIIYKDSVDKDIDKLRGGTYHLIHWAEVAFSQFELGVTIHDVWMKVLRWTLKNTNGMSYFESTPNGDNGWRTIWEDTDKYPQHKRIKLSASTLVEMGLMDEAFYNEQKNIMPLLEFEQEMECKFVTFKGRAYEEFEAHHIWNEMPAPKAKDTVFFAIDWGWDPSATCVVFAYKFKNRICVFEEIYSKGLLNDELAVLFNEKIKFWKINKFMGVGDHDAKAIEELKREYIPIENCNKVNALGNRMELKSLLKNDLIYIHPRCTYVIKDLKNAVFHTRKNDGSLDSGKCTWGHWDAENALRYLIRMYSAVKGSQEEEEE